MNVGQMLEAHLGWAAAILGFEAKTPVFQGANETEIGALMRLAGLQWAAETLRLEQRPPELDPDTVRAVADDLRHLPAGDGTRRDVATAGLSLLAHRALTPATRELFRRLEDFLKFAAKDLAERELAQRRIEKEAHEARLAAAELGKVEKAGLKAGVKAIEKFLSNDKPQDELAPVVLRGLSTPLPRQAPAH